MLMVASQPDPMHTISGPFSVIRKGLVLMYDCRQLLQYSRLHTPHCILNLVFVYSDAQMMHSVLVMTAFVLWCISFSVCWVECGHYLNFLGREPTRLRRLRDRNLADLFTRFLRVAFLLNANETFLLASHFPIEPWL